MTTDGNASAAAATATKQLSAKVIGLGGAGIQVVDFMAQTDPGELSFAAVHSDARALARSSAPEKLLLGAKIMRGLGAGGDPDLGEAAAEEEASGLNALCAGVDLVFIVAGLGGGTATGAAPVLARVARESGALVLATVTTPFDFEGVRRQQQARVGVQQLKAAADGVLCLPHQRLVKLLDEPAGVIEVFKQANELLAQGVRSIWQMLTRRGLLKVDFGDLGFVLRGRHFESSFACVQAEGEDRARVIIEKLLASPLLEEGKLFAEAEAILVSLVGGPDLTMADVNGVMQRIHQQAENAQFIVGAAIDDHYQARLGVTAIVSIRGQPLKDEFVGNSSLSNENGLPRRIASPEIENQFFGAAPLPRPAFRFVPPPPDFSPEQATRLLAQRGGSKTRRRKTVSRWSQGQLPLEIVSKGRFEKSEPTVYHGEDLDVPTYIRRGMALN